MNNRDMIALCGLVLDMQRNKKCKHNYEFLKDIVLDTQSQPTNESPGWKLIEGKRYKCLHCGDVKDIYDE